MGDVMAGHIASLLSQGKCGCCDRRAARSPLQKSSEGKTGSRSLSCKVLWVLYVLLPSSLPPSLPLTSPPSFSPFLID